MLHFFQTYMLMKFSSVSDYDYVFFRFVAPWVVRRCVWDCCEIPAAHSARTSQIWAPVYVGFEEWCHCSSKCIQFENSKGSIQYHIRRLIVRSRKVSEGTQYWWLELSNCSEIWQGPIFYWSPVSLIRYTFAFVVLCFVVIMICTTFLWYGYVITSA